VVPILPEWQIVQSFVRVFYVIDGVHRVQCSTGNTVEHWVLGPRLFILYTADLVDVTEKHGVTLHAFAVDTQLYLHCRRDDMASTALQLERCLSDVGH